MFVALVISMVMALSCSVEAEQKLRVVLISLDTLRQDQLDPTAESAPAMPRTLARARDALWFMRFYVSAPATQPAHASMFTGLQPWEHGITRNGSHTSIEAQRASSSSGFTISTPTAPMDRAAATSS